MKTTAWIIIIVIVLMIGTGVYFLTQNNNKAQINANVPMIPSNPSTPSNTNTNPSATTKHVDIMGDISNNHGHTIVLTAAQQDAGQAVTLLLTVGSGHTHTLSLSAAQVQAIAAGTTVSETSSVNSGHSHLVTFN